MLLQKARCKINDPSLFERSLVVLDIDDADFLDDRCVDHYHSVASRCDGFICGSRFTRDWAKQFGKPTAVVWTGRKPSSRYNSPIPKASVPSVVWACSNPHAYRHEGELVQAAMCASRVRPLSFLLAGVRDAAAPAEWLRPIAASGIDCRTAPFCSYRKLLQCLEPMHIGLVPLVPELSPFSAGKSFGKVLAYLDARVATVASNCVDHPLFFRHRCNGMLATNVAEWSNAIDELAANLQRTAVIAEQARQGYLRRLTDKAAAKLIDQFLRSLIQA